MHFSLFEVNFIERYKGLRNAAYICQKLVIFGGMLWIVNAVIFFWQYFSTGMKFPDFRLLVDNYGGALIAVIVPILLLYSGWRCGKSPPGYRGEYQEIRLARDTTTEGIQIGL